MQNQRQFIIDPCRLTNHSDLYLLRLGCFAL